MTLYIQPFRNRSRRRMMDELLRDWDEDYSSEISFPIDVLAEDDAYIIRALLPGVQAEDLNIQIVNEILTISGELKPERKEGGNYLLSECPSGKFHRVISLPTPLNASNVEAELEGGILTLTVPKAEEAKPHSIKIKAK